MDYKKTVLLGMVLSALLATLVIYQWVSTLAAGIIMLAAGLLATVYAALNQVLVEKLKRMELLEASEKRIWDQQGEEQVIKELLHWASFLVSSERSFYDSLDQAESPGAIDHNQTWSSVSRLISEEGKAMTWPGHDLTIQVPDNEVRSFLGLPLAYGGRTRGILYLVNRQGQERFSSRDQALVQTLVEQAGRALQGEYLLAECAGFYQELIHYVLQGMESPDFKGHAARVAQLAAALGSKLGIKEAEAEELLLAAQLHDVGKAAPELEGNREEEKVEEGQDHHPRRGADFFPDQGRFGHIKEAIFYHHERYNGSGYPEGLLRNDIPLFARIIAAADIFDALTHLGPEEQRLNPVEAYAVMKKATGMLFDPMVIVVLEELLPQLEK
ncbi:MAG TPA: HD domain-containing phosphohydrolase [Syntrophomonadaceae bacterium]|nr:HD domain-containing phosphohydrolase [Syntrophomonadaceae bacterium]